MSLFWKREREVRRLIEAYFAAADEAIEHFRGAMQVYLDGGDGEAFVAADRSIHAAESRADDLRVEIEVMLYRRALLPESRGDILGLLESYDRMPNLAEYITFSIDTENLVVPEPYLPRFRELVDVNTKAYAAVRRAADLLFRDPDAVAGAVKPVDQLESASDRLERHLIRDLFRSDMDRAECILLRDLIQAIGDISDAAERVCYRLQILSLKRRI